MQGNNKSKLILAESYIKSSNYTDALDILLSALSALPKCEKESRLDLQLKIAQVYERLGTPKTHQLALKLLNKVKKDSFSINYTKGLDGYYYQTGIMTGIHQKKWLVAKDHFDKSLQFKQIEKPKDYSGIAKVNLQLGTIYSHLAEDNDNDIALYNMAKKYCYKSLRYRNKTKDLKGQAKCFQGLGNIYKRSGKYKIANRWYEKFQNISNLIGNAELIGDSALSLAEIYSSIGDAQKTKEQQIIFYKKAHDKIKTCYNYRKKMSKNSKQYKNFKSLETKINKNLTKLLK